MLQNRKTSIIILIILALLGSFINFYALNLVLSDVGNSYYGIQDLGLFASLPGFMFALDFVLATIFILRIYRRPKYKKNIYRLYLTILASFSFVGLISAFIAGGAYYKSFVSPYPFPGYLIISIIIHTLLLISSLFFRFYIEKKLDNDKEKRKMKFSYVLYTVFLSVLVFYAYNRFGALLWSPIYVQWRTLYLTFPFYCWLISPLLLLTIVCLYMYNIMKKIPKTGFIIVIAIVMTNLLFGIPTLIIGALNPLFVSAISPALGLERLATKPLDVIFMMALGLIFGTYEILYSYEQLIKRKDK